MHIKLDHHGRPAILANVVAHSRGVIVRILSAAPYAAPLGSLSMGISECATLARQLSGAAAGVAHEAAVATLDTLRRTPARAIYISSHPDEYAFRWVSSLTVPSSDLAGLRAYLAFASSSPLRCFVFGVDGERFGVRFADEVCELGIVEAI